MAVVRSAAAAGTFYPGTAVELRKELGGLLNNAEPPAIDLEPAMVIVPHAGYVYSGPVAAAAYALLRSVHPSPRRIVALGPSHFVRFAGIAGPDADVLQTPLGPVAVDADSPETVIQSAAAHAREHSLEVQLPFLQYVLDAFTVLPLLTGDVPASVAAEVLDRTLDRTGAFGVISSDLSHYHDYATATERDGRTAHTIVRLQSEELEWQDACGLTAVQAALLVARRRGWQCRLLDLRNSGDTAGDRQWVVGYGAFVLGPVPPTR
jgi:AmmeMemoRadiSam system protein B